MKKWAAPGTLIDSISAAGFATVMNVQQALSKISGTPTTADDPGRVQDRQQPPELPVAPVHVRRAGR